MKLKLLIKNFNLLNILLLSVIVLSAQYSFFLSHTAKPFSTLPAVKKSFEAGENTPVEIQKPSPADYVIVSEENLFHPERKIPVEKKEEQPLPKPDFVLYGILITDDMRIAYMEDLKAPRNTPGRGKRQTALRKGDTLSGFALKEIETDKVVMLRGEEKIVIPVSDPSRQREQHEPVVTTTTPKQPQRRTPGIPTQKDPTIQNPAQSSTTIPLMNSPQTPSQQRGGSYQRRGGLPDPGTAPK